MLGCGLEASLAGVPAIKDYTINRQEIGREETEINIIDCDPGLLQTQWQALADQFHKGV
jgi:hypothetical protein